MAEHGVTITELPVCLTLDRHVYMSTLSDLLNGEMAKLDVSPGTVTLAMLKNKSNEIGFLFKRAEFDMKQHKMEQILATRKGAYGLDGTYYSGESNNPDHLRFLNEYFAEHLDPVFFPEPNSEDDSEEYIDYDDYNDDDCSSSTDEKRDSVENCSKEDNSGCNGNKNAINDKEPSDCSKEDNSGCNGNKNAINDKEPSDCSKEDNSGCNGNKNAINDKEPSDIELELEDLYEQPDSDGDWGYTAYEKARQRRRLAKLAGRPRKFKCLNDYHNLPILFFLKCEPASDNDTDENACKLKDITLKKVEEKTDPFIAWQVNGRGEELGYAIQMKSLMLVGDQAGIAVFGNAIAFGNYVPDYDVENYTEDDDYLWHGNFVYKCKIKPCTCRLYYENPYKRRKIN